MELGNEFDLKDIEQTTKDYLSKWRTACGAP